MCVRERERLCTRVREILRKRERLYVFKGEKERERESGKGHVTLRKK